MSNVVPFEKSNLPAAFQDQVEDLGVNDDLSGGMGTGFSVLSVKGSRWRLKMGGESEPIVNRETGEVVPSIEVILLKANPHYSKIYYEKNYSEGDDGAPDCFSINGETPDPSVETPINDSCANCPHNVWGSKINEDTGDKGKLCQDHRRVAVLFTGELQDEDPDRNVVGPTLLRVPAASLKDLKAYGKGLTAQHGLPYFAVVTRLGFDPDVAYPKLTFKAVRPVSEEEANIIVEHMGGEIVNSILTGQDLIATDAAPAPKKKQPAKKAKKEAPKTVDTSFEEQPSEEATAPASKKKSPAKKKAAPTQEEAEDAEVVEPEESEPAAEGGASEDIESIMDDLDSLDL